MSTQIVRRERLAGLTLPPWSIAYRERVFALIHDLRQPLAALGAEAAACRNWLSAAPNDHAQLFAAFEAVREDVQRAGSLLDRLQPLLVPTASTHCDLESLLDETVETLKPALREQSVSLALTCTKLGTRVMTDAGPLRQVLGHLVLCMAHAGQTPRRSRTLALRASRARLADRAYVRVAIDGRDMRSDETPGAVGPSDSALLEAGVSLCRLILERYGGHLELSANGEDGALLCLMLPAREG